MDQVRIAIIGLGKMGRMCARIFHEHPLSTIAAVCARRQEPVDEVAAQYKLAGYTDHRKMLDRKDIDAVIVSTPDNSHYEFARAALESGRHVFVEKPFTTKTDEADALLRLAHEEKRKIQVAFNHRWLSAYYQTHSSIAAGSIGNPLVGYARKNDTISVSTQNIRWAGETTPAWLLSSHDIDLIRWFVASERHTHIRHDSSASKVCLRLLCHLRIRLGIPQYLSYQCRFIRGGNWRRRSCPSGPQARIARDQHGEALLLSERLPEQRNIRSHAGSISQLPRGFYLCDLER
jgi:predicted dehydrogenase